MQFIKGINLTKKLINVPNEDKVSVKQLRKSLIYGNNKSWVKKEIGLFCVSMGASNGAEVRKLVGTFLLFKL